MFDVSCFQGYYYYCLVIGDFYIPLLNNLVFARCLLQMHCFYPN